MAIDGRLLRQALDALENDRREREAKRTALRAEIYDRLPRAAEIDRQLRMTMAGMLGAVLGGGEKSEEAVSAAERKNLALQAERRKLLKDAGLEPDCLDELPVCEKCGDTGFVGTKICGCLMTRYREAQRQALSALLKLGEETFNTFNLEYYDTAPDADGVSPREAMKLVFESCREYARSFGNVRENLFLQGGTGLGKTFLSACIAKVVSEKGFSVVYDTAVNIFAAFEDDKFGKAGAAEARETVRRYLNCDLLILDDLGTEMPSGFVSTALYTLINTRLTNGKQTVINSNLSRAELERRYTPQILSRLEGEYLPLRFRGRDIRRIKREQM